MASIVWGLCTENVAMVRVVFHYERLEEIQKIDKEQYCDINGCIFLPRKSPYKAGFWPVNRFKSVRNNTRMWYNIGIQESTRM